MKQYEIWWADLPKPAGKRPVLPLTRSDAYFDNLRTVSREWLVERVSALPAHRACEVKRALGYALAWDELMDLGPA